MFPASVVYGVGAGLIGGIVGVAVYGASRAVAWRVRGEEPGRAPERAMAKALHVAPTDAAGERRLDAYGLFEWGTAWGVVRGILSGIGLSPVVASLVHFVGTSVQTLASLPLVDRTPRDWRDLAWVGAQNALFAAATGAVVAALMPEGAAEMAIQPRPTEPAQDQTRAFVRWTAIYRPI